MVEKFKNLKDFTIFVFLLKVLKGVKMDVGQLKTELNLQTTSKFRNKDIFIIV